jgi:hypothetical protein
MVNHRKQEMKGCVAEDSQSFIGMLEYLFWPPLLLFVFALVVIFASIGTVKSMSSIVIAGLLIALGIFSIPAVWITLLVRWVVNKIAKD